MRTTARVCLSLLQLQVHAETASENPFLLQTPGQKNLVAQAFGQNVSKILNRASEERTADKRFPCPVCWKTYKYQRSLSRHRKFECGKLPSFYCPFCSHKSKLKEHLKSHVMMKHPTERQMWPFIARPPPKPPCTNIK
ncbi:telomere zinc finger-associated protein-like [Cimex lectularius]|uniref:C2H2-type domain-containing protein n=1 Tax=Cimex lectularius TaxID=79782 RepID=A0A8I6SCQ3_CIMLE|nr:telomere zinc finger-associated protein-like [Cimex lectularius]